MRFTTKVTSLIAAGGVAALGVGLLAFAPGVGAAFTSGASGTATIATGTFNCQLTSTDTSVTISNNGHTATVNLGTITSSAAGSLSAPLTLTNTGSIPLLTSWTVATTGDILGGSGAISAIPAASGEALAPTETQMENIGFQWSELSNSDLGRSGSAVYTVDCTEPGPFGAAWLFAHTDSTATWDGTNVTLSVPATPSDTGAGIKLLEVASGSSLPSSAPGFTTDTYGAGTPRMAIKMSNGQYLVVYPSQRPVGVNTYNLPGMTATDTWSDVTAYAAANSLTVVKAFVIEDTSNGGNANPMTSVISCVQYNGNYLFGSGC